MRQFKYKTGLFSKFFNQYHKEFDTYKDSEGKGLLERFVEICGEYIDDNIIKDIESLTDNIDFDTCPETFISYWWEYFGYIPYAYSILNINPTPSYYDINNLQIRYPNPNSREVLKYAISLYKIRCTSLFYEVLGRFYRVYFEFIPVNFSELAIPETKYDKHVKYDKKYQYDQNNCLECLKYTVVIHISQGTHDYLEAENLWPEAYKAFLLILNKYLPLHVELLTNDDISFEISNTIINI